MCINKYKFITVITPYKTTEIPLKEWSAYGQIDQWTRVVVAGAMQMTADCMYNSYHQELCVSDWIYGVSVVTFNVLQDIPKF